MSCSYCDSPLYGDKCQTCGGNAPSNANTSGLGDAGLSETYRFAYESIRNGAPGLSDATCAAIARSINMKVSLSKTDCATETDALRLVPRRAVYDWLRDDVPLNVKMTVMPHHIDALMDRLSKTAPASPLPGGGWQDISTAPRTGEEFQAWWKGTWQPRARFDPEYGSFQLWGRTDFDTEGWEVFEIDGYWQPHPAAPTGESK